MKEKPFRIDLPFEDAVKRALDTKPISDADLKAWVQNEKRGRKPAKATVKKMPRRAAHR